MKKRYMGLLTCLVACGGDVYERREGSVAAAVVNAQRSNQGRGPRTDLPHVVASPQLSGALPASSGVREGTYEYNMPLRVPDGAGGVEPALSFSYSSQGANGAMGAGWALTGTSAISRCSYNMASDGRVKGFDFNPDYTKHLNKYCIDGVKLVPNARANGTVTYQTEAADFSRVTAFFASSQADPDYFKVELRDGTVKYYGDVDGRSPAVTNVVSRTGRGVYAWNLSKVTKLARTMYYEYESPTLSAAFASETRNISRIDYGNRSVRFVWEPRPDHTRRAAFGFNVGQDRRLKRVEMYTADSLAVPIYQYLLSYEASNVTNHSLLTKIELADKDGVRTQPTTFSWGSTSANRSPETPPPWAWYDFQNADYPLVYDSPGTVPFPSGELNGKMITQRVFVNDFNGDGLDDVMYIGKRGGSRYFPALILRLSSVQGNGAHTLGAELDVTGSIFTPVTLDGSTIPPVVAPMPFLYGAFTADVDGDGKTELFVRSSDSVQKLLNSHPVDTALRVYSYKQATGAFQDVTASGNLGAVLTDLRGTLVKNYNQPPAQETERGPNSINIPVQFGDFNGDGVLDLVGGATWGQRNIGCGPSGTCPGRQVVFTGEQTHQVEIQSARRDYRFVHEYGGSDGFVLGDIDGDGRTDALSMEGTLGPSFVADDANGIFTFDRGARLPCTRSHLLDDFGQEFPTGYCIKAAREWRQIFDWDGDGVGDILDFSDMAGHGYCGISSATPSTTRQVKFKMRLGDGVWTADEPNPSGFQDVNLTGLGIAAPALGCNEVAPAYYPKSVRLGDFNGDGMTDILLLHSGGFYDQLIGWQKAGTGQLHLVGYDSPPVLLLSTVRRYGGQNFIPVPLPALNKRMRQTTSNCFKKENGLWVPNDASCARTEADFDYAQVGDVNGDGLTDLVQLVFDGAKVRLLTTVSHAQTPTRDLIVAVKNGVQQGTSSYGLVETIEYADISKLGSEPSSGVGPHYACDSALLPTYSDPQTDQNGVRTATDLQAICPRKGRMVVTAYHPAGYDAATPGIRYSYNTAISDPRGQGFIGFAAVRSYDYVQKRGTTTSKHYTCQTVQATQDFGRVVDSREIEDNGLLATLATGPLRVGSYSTIAAMSGRFCFPDTITTSSFQGDLTAYEAGNLIAVPVATGVPLRRSTTTSTFRMLSPAFENETVTWGTYQILPQRVDAVDEYLPAATYVYDRNAETVRSSVEYAYDSFNNPRLIVEGTESGTTQTTTTVYKNTVTPTAWFIGQPEHITITRKRPGLSDLTRTLDHTYDDTWGSLLTTTVQANGGPELKKVTTYGYRTTPGSSDFRNVISVTESAADMTVAGNPMRSRVTQNVYDADGRHVVQTISPSGTTTYTYASALDSLIAVVDPNGEGIDYVLNSLGRRLATMSDDGYAVAHVAAPTGYGIPAQAGVATGVTTTDYVAVARTAGACPGQSVRTPPGTALNTPWCFAPRSITITNSIGQTTERSRVGFDGTVYRVTTSYDGRGREWKTTTPFVGVATPADMITRTYDGLNRLTNITSAADARATQSWSYPSRFRTETTRLWEDNKTVRLSTSFDIDGHAVDTEEIAAGNLGAPAGTITTSTTYDTFDNVTSLTRTNRNGQRQVTSLTYDGLGRTKTVVSAAGTRTSKYDGYGELYEEGDAVSTRILINDGAGRLTKRVNKADPNDYERYDYDPVNGKNQLSTVTRMPDNVVTAYDYNAAGQLQFRSVTQRDQDLGASKTYRVEYGYDSLGRTASISYPGPTLSAGPEFGGVRLVVSYNDYGHESAYDVVERVPGAPSRRVWSVESRTPELIVEKLGTDRKTTVLDPARGWVMAMQTTSASGATIDQTSLTHYVSGDLKSKSEAVKGGSSSFRYDSLGRLESWGWSNGSAQPFRKEYAYDDFGNLTGTKTYDAVTGGAVTSSETSTLGGPNPWAVSKYVSPAGALMPAKRCQAAAECAAGACVQGRCETGEYTYAYDSLGRRTEKRWVDPTTGNQTYQKLVYNHFDLPSSIERHVVTSGTTETVTTTDAFRYDGFGRRAYHGELDNGVHIYYVDTSFERRDGRSAGEGDRYIAHIGLGTAGILDVDQSASSSGTATTVYRYSHTERTSSPYVEAVNTSSASTYRSLRYEPFGVAVDPAGASPRHGYARLTDATTQSGFGGHETDRRGELINMQGRLYDPLLRRFLTPDRFAINPSTSQGHNPYSYVLNNPTSYSDPSGFTPSSDGDGDIADLDNEDHEGSVTYSDNGADVTEDGAFERDTLRGTVPDGVESGSSEPGSVSGGSMGDYEGTDPPISPPGAGGPDNITNGPQIIAGDSLTSLGGGAPPYSVAETFVRNTVAVLNGAPAPKAGPVVIPPGMPAPRMLSTPPAPRAAPAEPDFYVGAKCLPLSPKPTILVPPPMDADGKPVQEVSQWDGKAPIDHFAVGKWIASTTLVLDHINVRNGYILGPSRGMSTPFGPPMPFLGPTSFGQGYR